MYQTEDLIRANHFDPVELEKNLISKFTLPENQMDELREWYGNLIKQMIKEEITVSGHLTSLKELIFKLNDFHIQLINTLQEEKYLELYKWASGFIIELKEKMKMPEITEIEVCINGLYGYMLLKLKNTDISQETSQVMAVFSQLLRYLAVKYHDVNNLKI
jgi:flagellin-specific chaperone FliS